MQASKVLKKEKAIDFHSYRMHIVVELAFQMNLRC